jgi:hypothetical protein
MNGPRIMCIACGIHVGGDLDVCVCSAHEALAELVELKRMKDAGTQPAEYERRKLIAWQEAFRVCGVIGEPKPRPPSSHRVHQNCPSCSCREPRS